MSRVPPRRVTVEACAKLNLGLVVGPLRDDGFHDLVTVFQSVSLADTLVAERSRHGFALEVRHEDVAIAGRAGARARAGVPAGPGNLVIRAAKLVHARFQLPGGARFRLTKRIPSQAGMGGGSADAAAAIAAVISLHGLRLPREARIALAAEIGSDVPFAITGGTAVGRGRGEVLRPVPLAAPVRALVAMPAWHVSTAAAFRQLDTAKYGLTGWDRGLRFASTLGRNQVTATCAERLGNSFERVLGDHQQDFDSLCARLLATGASRPRLTGSGSAVFAILPEGLSAREAAKRFNGDERLFAVRSRRSGLWTRTQS